MKNKINLLVINCLFMFFALFIACNYSESRTKEDKSRFNFPKIQSSDKINGVNFVAPAKAINAEWTNDLKNVNSNWVSLVPYAFTTEGSPNVIYNYSRQYWGESPAGIKENTQQAHKAGLKVMLKPHVWAQGGWIGDFNLRKENDWITWEQDYRNYMMQLTQIAVDENIEMICVGTEYKNAVIERPKFWKSLIQDIRKVYQGKLTYCANWDDYEGVSFWEDLDYIGISAYFPLVDSKSAKLTALLKAWTPIKKELAMFSANKTKPILFTEYGYRSMDNPAWRSWEKEYQKMPINNEAQANAYDALYQTFWKEDWFAGGFAWKWYSSFSRMDSVNNHDWTPQNKKAQSVMKQYYDFNKK